MRFLLALLACVYCGVALAQVQQVTLPCPLRAGQTFANPPCQAGFPVALTGIGNGGQEIIIGTINGWVVAVNSSGTVDWSFKTGTVPINGKAAVGDLRGNGE